MATDHDYWSGRVADLRVRLAEVEAERDRWETLLHQEQAWGKQRTEEFTAKLAEVVTSVEAEVLTKLAAAEAENADLRRRLAEVEAVVSAARAWTEKYDKPNRRPSGAEGKAVIRAVRALDDARGEGDRPAEPGIWPGGGIAFSELRPAVGTRPTEIGAHFTRELQPAAEPPWPCINDGRPCNDEACRPAAEPTAEVKPLVLGEPCPYDGGEVMDGGSVGLYCSTGFRCKQPLPFHQPPAEPTGEPAVKCWHSTDCSDCTETVCRPAAGSATEGGDSA